MPTMTWDSCGVLLQSTTATSLDALYTPCDAFEASSLNTLSPATLPKSSRNQKVIVGQEDCCTNFRRRESSNHLVIGVRARRS